MIRYHMMPQRSDEWFAIRRGKLTASTISDLVSSTTTTIYKALKEADHDEVKKRLGRAKKQFEEFQKISESGDLGLNRKECNPAMVKPLIEKGLVIEEQHPYGVTIKSTKAIFPKLIAQAYARPQDLTQTPINYAMQRGVELEDEARMYYEIAMDDTVEEIGFVTNSELGDCIGVSPDGMIDGRKGLLEIKCPMAETHVKYLLADELPAEYKNQVHMQMAVTDAEYCWFMSYCPKFIPLMLRIDRNEYTENMREALFNLSSDLESATIEFGERYLMPAY